MSFARPQHYAALLVALIVTCATSIGCSEGSDSNAQMVQLGGALFQDPRLSADGRVSCSTCHDPKLYFTDARPVSIGVNGQVGTRNAPSLLDVFAMQSFFWDGRETNLPQVVLQPFTNSVEMGLPDREALLQRIGQLPGYPDAFSKAFENDTIDARTISAALTAYLQSSPKGKSRYDEYRASNQKNGLNGEEQMGLALFEGKAACTTCHRLDGSNANLSDNLFHHTGIGFDKVAGNVGSMISRLDDLKKQGRALGNAILTSRDVAELGRFAITRRPADLGAFRTPSLRNVAMTAPYMHDGSVPTLSDAVEREIYYRGLARGRPISLTVTEQSQLLAFLQSLTEQ